MPGVCGLVSVAGRAGGRGRSRRRRPQTVVRASGPQVWAGLPEVNRQVVVGRLAELAGRVLAVVVAVGERG